MSLLKSFEEEPSRELDLKIKDQEEILQPESILHKDKVRNGKVIRRYLIKFKSYPFKDARWM